MQQITVSLGQRSYPIEIGPGLLREARRRLEALPVKRWAVIADENTAALLEAMETGKVLADGAQPLIGKELTGMEMYEGFTPRVFLNFLLPVLMIVVTALSTYVAYHSAKTMEAFTLVVIFMTISMMIQGIPFKEVMDTMMNGIKGALPAVVLLAVNLLEKK